MNEIATTIDKFGIETGVIIICVTFICVMFWQFIRFLKEERAERQEQSREYKVLAENHIAHNTEVMSGLIQRVADMGKDQCREHAEMMKKLE